LPHKLIKNDKTYLSPANLACHFNLAVFHDKRGAAIRNIRPHSKVDSIAAGIVPAVQGKIWD
jgi:hypothetical protein